jgi:hypothetical protein
MFYFCFESCWALNCEIEDGMKTFITTLFHHPRHLAFNCPLHQLETTSCGASEFRLIENHPGQLLVSDKEYFCTLAI